MSHFIVRIINITHIDPIMYVFYLSLFWSSYQRFGFGSRDANNRTLNIVILS